MAPRRKSSSMSAEHKRALAQGREQSRVVRNYLEALEQNRPKRDPARWSASELAPGLKEPAKFIRDHKIGWPVYGLTPQRRLSWWFNTSMEQFSLLGEAGVEIRQITPGAVRGPPCK